MVLIQINFDMPALAMGDALTEAAEGLAKSINNEAGFLSKLWIENTETEESGGIYLFEDMETAKAYVEMHTPRVEAMGASRISAKCFRVNEVLSKLNKGI